jgi:dihydrolipoamide dehydrogenase
MTDGYDLAIIGSGPGGYVAAIRAGQLGLRVAIIEREPELGGVCLNWGCIPSKSLLANAEMVRFVERKAGEFGLGFESFSYDWQQAVKRSRRVVKRMTRGVAGLMKKNQVTVVSGEARFVDANTLAIEGGEVERVEARHVIVATGSRARLLPGMVADGEKIITSRHAVNLDQVPGRLLIMGAGAVGMELAYVYSAYGAQVVVIEMLDRVLPLEDAEAGAVVARHFEKLGIGLRVATRVEEVDTSGDGVVLTVSGGGETSTIEGDKVLVAIGRAPNTEGLGLEDIGVESERGFVQTDEYGRTTVEHVFAIGDIAGPPMLAHKASHEGVVAVETIAGREAHPVDATFIPSCTYCHPQVASIGLTEEMAREAGYEVQVSKFPFMAIGKAVAIADYEGWVKIVSDTRYGEILGATIVGPDATELIHELALARSAELTADEIAEMVHAHPTLSEALHEAALGVSGAPLHI